MRQAWSRHISLVFSITAVGCTGSEEQTGPIADAARACERALDEDWIDPDTQEPSAPPEVREVWEQEYGIDGRCYANAPDPIYCESLCGASDEAMDDIGFTGAIAPFDPTEPGCFSACAAGIGSGADDAAFECLIAMTVMTADLYLERTLPSCGEEDPSPPVGACWRAITDPAQMNPICTDFGSNLELVVDFADGPPSDPYRVSAMCALSQNKARDCPGLP